MPMQLDYLVTLYLNRAMKQIANDMFFSWVESEIEAGREVRFRLKGHSMFPLLRNGKDDVVLQPCAYDALKVMDVVLFRYGGKHLLHRIIRIEGDTLYMQGDGVMVSEEKCTASDVVGKVCMVIRPSGVEIPTSKWRWRLPSILWRKTGVLRGFLLRVLRHMI